MLFFINRQLESSQFNAEVKFDKIFDEAYKKFDKISMDSITKTQSEKYMKKASKYFNESLNFRLSYNTLYDINDKKIKEIWKK